MELTAHRGFAGRHPENTRRAVREAAPLSDWIEIDVRRCGSGEPVVVHDATVDRVTDASGPVADYTAAELADLSVLGSGEGIPTLAAMLSAWPDGVGCNVELKEPVWDALALVREAGLDRVVVCSFDAAVLREVGERSAFDRGYIAGKRADPESALSTAADLDCWALHPHHSLVDTALVEAAHDRGLVLNAWTVVEESTADRLRAAGVHGVVADHPDVV